MATVLPTFAEMIKYASKKLFGHRVTLVSEKVE